MKMSSFFRRLAVVAIVATLTVFALNLIVDNPYSHRIARELINEKTRELTSLVVDFKAVKVTAFPIGIDLFGIEIAPSSNPSTPVLRASQMRARLSLTAALLGEIKLSVFALNNLEISWPLPQEVDDALKQLQGQPKTPDEPVRWPPDLSGLPVETLSLRNARIYFEVPRPADANPKKPGSPLGISLAGFDLDLDLANENNIQVETNVQALTLKTFERVFVQDARLQLELAMGPKEMRRGRYVLEAHNAIFRGAMHGTTERDRGRILNAFRFEAGIEGEGDLSILGRLLDEPESRGMVRARGGIKVFVPVESDKPFDFAVEVDAEVKDGVLARFQLFDAKSHLNINEKRIQFSNANIVIDGHDFGDATGSIAFNETTDIEFSGKLKQLPLSRLMEALTVEFDLFEGGLSSDNVLIKGTGDPLRLEVSSSLRMEKILTPLLEIKRGRVDDPTNCDIELGMLVTGTYVDFKDTKGSCARQLQFERGSTKGGSQLQAKGRAYFDSARGMDLKVQTPALDFALLSDILQHPSRGSGPVDISVSGGGDKMVTTISADAKGLELFGMGLGTAKLRAMIKNAVELHWEEARFDTAGGGEIESKGGMLRLTKDLHVDAPLTAKGLQANFVGAFIEAVSDDDRFRMQLRQVKGRFKGPLLTPLAYTGQVEFETIDATYGDIPLWNNLAAQLTMTGKGIEAPRITYAVRDFLVVGRGSYKRTRPFQYEEALKSSHILERMGWNGDDEIALDLSSFQQVAGMSNAANFRTKHLQIIPVVRDYARMFQVDGNISANLHLRGKLFDPEGQMNYKIMHASLYGSSIAGFQGNVMLSPDRIDVVTSHGGKSLEGRMEVALVDGVNKYPFKMYMKANRMDLRAFLSPFFSSDARNFAYVNGEWSAEGDLLEFWRSKGHIQLDDARLFFTKEMQGTPRTVGANLVHPVLLNHEGGTWSFAPEKSLELRGQQLYLKVGANNNHLPDKMRWQIEGFVEAELLRNYFSFIESATGALAFDGVLEGSMASIRPNIRLRALEDGMYVNQRSGTKLDPLSLGVTNLRPPFRDVKFEARIFHDRLTLGNLSATKGRGSLTGSGTLVFDPNANEDSRVEFEFVDAELVYPVAVLNVFESELSGTVAITGKGFPFNIAGDVAIKRAQATRQFDLRSEIIQALQRRNYEAQLLPTDPRFKLDLKIVADDSIRISNRNMQITMSSNINLSGTDTQPVIIGQVEISDGTFAYKYNRDFRITQGLITFDDPVRPDPRLDILAMREVSGYRLFMAITGRASDPRIDLSADPPSREDGTPLTKVDILVLLSTGNLPSSDRSEVSTQDAARAEALNVLVGQIEEPVEKIFDLSGQSVVRQVYIDTYAGKDGAPSPRLNFPLNLHNDWDVIFRLEESSWRVSLGYDVHKSISVSGSFDRQSQDETKSGENTNPTDTGVDLKFKFAFP